MSERKTVWVVEAGEYSDYRVVGIYTSEEKANAVAVAAPADGPVYDVRVSEWPLDPGLAFLGQQVARWCVVMDKDGTVRSVDPNEDVWGHWRNNYTFWNQPERMRGEVWARDAKHAVKIVNEQRTRTIAENDWPEGEHALVAWGEDWPEEAEP